MIKSNCLLESLFMGDFLCFFYTFLFFQFTKIQDDKKLIVLKLRKL